MLGTLQSLILENGYLDFPEHFYQRNTPTSLKGAHLISFNPEVARLLDLNPCKVNPDELAYYFGGGGLLPTSQPLAMKYAGHQFGSYNPDLGDGRGLLLGEVVNQQGERWDLHLKGAGKTAFSRFGDGKAVLRSSIREYLVSEAMHGLNIPTTRALCLIGSHEYTLREGMEPCAMVLRVSQSHIRFGHFEHFYYSRKHDDLKRLAEYCLERYFPDLIKESDPYLAMFREIRDRSINMVAKWQAYGFVHGVMNTDNMSILGETFDYGPYTFMDNYRADFVSSHTDHQGRYAFQRQPDIVLWNLSCLAQALLPLTGKEKLIESLDEYKSLYLTAYYQLMRKRLGLQVKREGDDLLVDQLIALASAQRIDLNRFLRDLCSFEPSQQTSLDRCLSHFSQAVPAQDWMLAYGSRLVKEAASTPIRQQQMRAVNPCYLLRNYMAEEAIKAANQGDYQGVNELLSVVRKPFEEKAEFAHYAEAPPEWASGISLSCSS